MYMNNAILALTKDKAKSWSPSKQIGGHIFGFSVILYLRLGSKARLHVGISNRTNSICFMIYPKQNNAMDPLHIYFMSFDFEDWKVI